jgi:hypothetical protein
MPAADGWQLAGLSDGTAMLAATTMEEAAAHVPEGAIVRLSLPVSAVLLERMHLPSVSREELDGMVVLQLEKTLPYGGEELTSGFEIIQQHESESDLLAIAVSNDQLDDLCAPLRSSGKLPSQVAVFAMQLAAKYPLDEVLALIFREGGATILAIAEAGKLVAAHACPTVHGGDFLAELPRMLLAAELEGAPVNFTKIAIDRGLAEWAHDIEAQLGGSPAILISLDQPPDPGRVNLVPDGWIIEQQRVAQKAKVRDWLLLAGAIYLFLLLAAAAYIIWLQRQVSTLDSQVVQATPAVDALASQKARWAALQPAVDPTKFTVEILQQINKSIPGADLHVTMFDHSPAGATIFTVEGEAPTASMAIQYADALRSNPDLAAFHFDSGPPEILPNEHAHFRIFARP